MCGNALLFVRYDGLPESAPGLGSLPSLQPPAQACFGVTCFSLVYCALGMRRATPYPAWGFIQSSLPNPDSAQAGTFSLRRLNALYSALLTSVLIFFSLRVH